MGVHEDKEIYDQLLVAVDYTVEGFGPLEACDCVFERCNFQQTDLRSKKFIDCEFKDCTGILLV